LSSILLSKTIKIKLFRNIILPGVLYGCETWTITLREESRLRVFEDRVLRRIFGQRSEELTGKRCLMNCIAHKYYSVEQNKKNKMGEVLST